MNEAISVELQFFLISILWGAILLLVYDGIRILRRIIKHNSFILAIEDLIFWVVSSVFIFAMMYKENNGTIRGFSVMGMTIGMVLYHYILSELLVEAVTKLIYIIFKPIKIMFKWIKRLLILIYKKVKKLCCFILLRLKKITKSVRITLNRKKQKKILKRELSREKKANQKKKQAQRKLMEKKHKDERARDADRKLDKQKNKQKNKQKKKVGR